MVQLVADNHLSVIGSLYWQKQQWHAPCGILKMRVNRASMIFGLASWVSYVRIGCRHPFMRYWQPLLAKLTGTWFLRHPENERQRSVNIWSTWIIRNHGIAQSFACITVSLTALLGKNTIYRMWNKDTKLFDIATCPTSKNTLLVAGNAILIGYY